MDHKTVLTTVALSLAIGFAGCGGGDASAPGDTPAAPLASGGSLSLSEPAPAVSGAQTPPGPTGPAPVLTPEQVSTPEKAIAAAVDPSKLGYFAAEGDAKAPKDTVELLDRAIQAYEALRNRTDDGDGPKWPVINDLNMLVQYKVLRALPPAPAGQKFVMDPKTKKVSLAPL